MAISKEKLREMRENSRLGAAKQHAKEQAALDRYMKRRNTEVKNLMSAKERNEAIKKAFNEEGKSVEEIVEAFALTTERVCKILGISEKPSGIIDAAELTTKQREELTAQAEADAGIYYDSDNDYDPCEDEDEPRGPYEYGPFTDEPEPRNAADKPQEEPSYDVGEIAGRIKYMLRIAMKSLDLPENIDIELCARNGLCELDVADDDESAMLTWRL